MVWQSFLKCLKPKRKGNERKYSPGLCRLTVFVAPWTLTWGLQLRFGLHFLLGLRCKDRQEVKAEGLCTFFMKMYPALGYWQVLLDSLEYEGAFWSPYSRVCHSPVFRPGFQLCVCCLSQLLSFAWAIAACSFTFSVFRETPFVCSPFAILNDFWVRWNKGKPLPQFS